MSQQDPAWQGDLLVVLRHAPHGSSWLREGLDAALVAAAFGQKVSLLFHGDGVAALIKGQGSGALGQKGTSATLDMLAMYDIESIYVDDSARAALELTEEDLMLSCREADSATIAGLIAGHALVLTF